jgi:hypothetical protein
MKKRLPNYKYFRISFANGCGKLSFFIEQIGILVIGFRSLPRNSKVFVNKRTHRQSTGKENGITN